jgi:tetratricopeptide (TPR) repeat protein
MAQNHYKRALTILEKSFGPNHIEVAEVLNSMGLVLKKRADYDGAEAYYTRAIDIVHKTFGYDQEHYKLGIYYNNLADLDRKRTKFDNALRLYQRALTAIEKTLGLQHSEAAEILHNIGQVQHQLGLLLREKKQESFVFFSR